MKDGVSVCCDSQVLDVSDLIIIVIITQVDDILQVVFKYSLPAVHMVAHNQAMPKGKSFASMWEAI
jgi:hypothetical protein